MDANLFLKDIVAAITAYQFHNVAGQEYRQGGKVPYSVHAIWQATMLLHDTAIPWDVRELGYQVLLYHDVLEDTSAGLPDWVSDEVRRCVLEMTFDNFESSLPHLPHKEPKIKLFIMIDKLSTFIEENLKPDPVKRRKWKDAVAYLTDETRKHYGRTKIVILAEAMLAASDW